VSPGLQLRAGCQPGVFSEFNPWEIQRITLMHTLPVQSRPILPIFPSRYLRRRVFTCVPRISRQSQRPFVVSSRSEKYGGDLSLFEMRHNGGQMCHKCRTIASFYLTNLRILTQNMCIINIYIWITIHIFL